MSVHHRGKKPPLQAAGDALTKTPAAPNSLSKWAKAEWRRVAPVLVERGVLTVTDLPTLESYCVAAGQARQITEILNAIPIPDVKLAGLQLRSLNIARQYGANLGLDPVSRQRMGAAVEVEDDDDPMSIR